MKQFFLLTILAFLHLNVTSQTDTIFRKDGKKTICTITVINQKTIYYKIKGEDIEEIDLSKVAHFTQLGKTQQAVNIQKKFLMLSDTSKLIQDSVLVSNELEFMKNCFKKHHQEHNIGGLTTLFGIGISVAGIVVGTYPKQADAARALFVVGGVISLIGQITMFDSHKWIGRAGLGINGNGLSVRYVFK